MKSFDIRRYKAILFDLDSTLTNSGNYAIEASKLMFLKCDSEVSVNLDDYFRILVRNYRSEIEHVITSGCYQPPSVLVRNAIKNSIEDLGFQVAQDVLDEGVKQFQSLHLKLSTAFPGVQTILSKFKSSGIKMGVITNSFVEHAHIILEKIGLTHFFEVVIDSGDVQCFKPNPVIFEYALGILDVPPDDALFIGDEYDADILGAYLTGINSIWINTRNHSLDKYIQKYGKECAPKLVLDYVTDLSKYI